MLSIILHSLRDIVNWIDRKYEEDNVFGTVFLALDLSITCLVVAIVVLSICR